MLERYGKYSEITKLMNSIDWYVTPVLNADGYVYTFTKVTPIPALLFYKLPLSIELIALVAREHSILNKESQLAWK